MPSSRSVDRWPPWGALRSQSGSPGWTCCAPPTPRSDSRPARMVPHSSGRSSGEAPGSTSRAGCAAASPTKSGDVRRSLIAVREPAYCAGRRFALSPQHVLRVWHVPAPRPEGLSRYGVISVVTDRGLPTALPVDYRSVLGPSSRCGLRRYERVC